jgi:hypothetical protein
MTIAYPKNLAEYRALRFDYNNDKLAVEDRAIAESFITHWKVVKGSYTLGVLTKLTGKKQQDVASDLGIKPRQLSGMINGVNTLNNVRSQLAKYFNVKEDLFNDYTRQTGKEANSRL